MASSSVKRTSGLRLLFLNSAMIFSCLSRTRSRPAVHSCFPRTFPPTLGHAYRRHSQWVTSASREPKIQTETPPHLHMPRAVSTANKVKVFAPAAQRLDKPSPTNGASKIPQMRNPPTDHNYNPNGVHGVCLDVHQSGANSLPTGRGCLVAPRCTAHPFVSIIEAACCRDHRNTKSAGSPLKSTTNIPSTPSVCDLSTVPKIPMPVGGKNAR